MTSPLEHKDKIVFMVIGLLISIVGFFMVDKLSGIEEDLHDIKENQITNRITNATQDEKIGVLQEEVKTLKEKSRVKNAR